MSDAKSRPGKASVIEPLAELAMRLSQPHLADYGAARSRHDFTRRQRLNCLVLRAYLKATYRGVLDVPAASAALRQCPGHWPTSCPASRRSRSSARVPMWLRLCST